MIMFSLFFILSFFANNLSKKEIKLFNKKNVIMVLFLFLFLLFIFSFRSSNVTGDTPSYVSNFIDIDPNSFSLNLFLTSNEPLFYVLNYVVRSFTSNYSIFLLFCSLPLIIGICLLFYNCSDDSFVSIVLFTALGILTFCMAGLRQSIAIGFCLIAYIFAEKRKFIPYIILILIGCLFHNSCIFFLPVYFLKKIKVTYFQWILIIAGLVIGITKWSGLQVFTAILGDNHSYYTEVGNSSLNYTMFFVQLALFIFCWIFRKEYLKNNENGKLLFNMAFIGLAFQAMVPALGLLFRASFFYSFSLCLLVPGILKSIKNIKYKYLFYWGIVCVAILFCFISQDCFSYYEFFWQV